MSQRSLSKRILSSDVLKSLKFLDRNVLVKGGDLPASLDAVDVFYDGIPYI